MYITGMFSLGVGEQLLIGSQSFASRPIARMLGEAPEKALWLNCPIQPVLNEGWCRVPPAENPCLLDIYPCRVAGFVQSIRGLESGFPRASFCQPIDSLMLLRGAYSLLMIDVLKDGEPS